MTRQEFPNSQSKTLEPGEIVTVTVLGQKTTGRLATGLRSMNFDIYGVLFTPDGVRHDLRGLWVRASAEDRELYRCALSRWEELSEQQPEKKEPKMLYREEVTTRRILVVPTPATWNEVVAAFDELARNWNNAGHDPAGLEATVEAGNGEILMVYGKTVSSIHPHG